MNRFSLRLWIALLSMPVLTHGAQDNLPQLVNTFIGSKDDGNTYPGASAPFGLVQSSPIGEHWAGWRYDDKTIRGFAHSFISGAGCWEQGGHVSILPVTGQIAPQGDFDTSKAASFDQKKYASKFSHDGEIGQAGYYRVKLTDYGGIDVEATALTRVAAERFTYLSNVSDAHVLVNVGQVTERHSVVGSSIRIVDDHTVEGKIVTNSFCGGKQYTTWFRTEFDRPFKSHGIWNESGGFAGAAGPSMQGDGRVHGAWLTFDVAKQKAVTAYTAISHVDAEGARKNLNGELIAGGQYKSFVLMREQAQKAWQQELNKIRISSDDRNDKTVFYTALYHSLLQPLTGSDIDGRYRGYDDQIHVASGWTYYEYFSLWDTYRTQNQLLALLTPERARDIATSLLAVQQQNGWLPRWGYANYDTNVMTGDPVTPFLVDLWRMGALKGREQEAYAALKQNAFGVPPQTSRSSGRAGNAIYMTTGFVPYDRAQPTKSMDIDWHHGGSATMEYALADCALAQMASALGYNDDASVLMKRAGNWRSVWDADVVDKELGFEGFPRAKLGDGKWYTEVNGDYSPRSHHGFHEGTAWQYQWLAYHDSTGLINAMGGRDAFERRLDAFFAFDALKKDPIDGARREWVVGPYSYYNQYRYNPNNEPDLHAPLLYNLIGNVNKTSLVMRAAQSLFTNAPNGVTGNDDLGTMSAWYVFSALGIYPGVPGSGQWFVFKPRFSIADIELGDRKILRIKTNVPSASSTSLFAGLQWNKKAQAHAWLSWDQIRAGGELNIVVTSARESKTGRSGAQAIPSGSQAVPASICAAVQ